jgi:hypothetical protein
MMPAQLSLALMAAHFQPNSHLAPIPFYPGVSGGYRSRGPAHSSGGNGASPLRCPAAQSC